MSKITPEFTDNVSVIGIQAFGGAAGGGSTARIIRGTLDLLSIPTPFGAFLMLDFGRTGTTAVSVGVIARINRMINGSAITRPGGILRVGNTVTAASNVNTTDAAAAQATWVSTNSLTGFAAGDIVYIGHSDGSRGEWQVIASISGTTVTFEDNLINTHTAAQADAMTNKADCFAPIWLPGGAQYEVILDYSQGTGDAQIVRALAQTYKDELLQ